MLRELVNSYIRPIKRNDSIKMFSISHSIVDLNIKLQKNACNQSNSSNCIALSYRKLF